MDTGNFTSDSSSEENALEDENGVESDDFGQEMAEVEKLLVSSCCNNFCLRYLTAMDIIACKKDYACCTY